MNKEALYNIAQHATRMSKQAQDPNSLTYVPGIDSGNGTPRPISPYLPQKPKANPQQGTTSNEPSWLDRFGGYLRTGANFLFGLPAPPSPASVLRSMVTRDVGSGVFSAAGNNLPKDINRYIQRPRPTGNQNGSLRSIFGSGVRTGLADDAGYAMRKNINRYIPQSGTTGNQNGSLRSIFGSGVRTGLADDAGYAMRKNINRYMQQPGFGGGSSRGYGADR